MVQLEMEVPDVYRGVVIGKEGANLKQMQAEFNVKVRLHKSEGHITVEGPRAKVDACMEKIRGLIASKARGADRPKKGKGSGKGKGVVKNKTDNGALPPNCPLCKSEMTSLPQALSHLVGCKHFIEVKAVRPEFTRILEQFAKKWDLLHLAEAFQDPQLANFHQGLGFGVEQLLAAIPAELQKREAIQQVKADAVSFSPDPSWLKIQHRIVVHWDTLESGMKPHSLTTAPHLAEMLSRCTLKNPPLAKIPSCPFALPQVNRALHKSNSLKARHMYPAEPGSSRLGVAIMTMLGFRRSDYDFVCGTSFVKALSGDSIRMQDAYYLQWFQGTVYVLHVPSRYHGQDEPGHAVERLICGETRGYFAAATTLTIDEHTFLVMSEVDATDQAGDLVEIKSSRANNFLPKEAVLQTALNGSKHVLACTLDGDRSRLESVQWMPTEEARQNNEDFIFQGQRARLMLGKVVDFMKDKDERGIWKVAFEHAGLSFALSTDAQVLPKGLD